MNYYLYLNYFSNFYFFFMLTKFDFCIKEYNKLIIYIIMNLLFKCLKCEYDKIEKEKKRIDVENDIKGHLFSINNNKKYLKKNNKNRNNNEINKNNEIQTTSFKRKNKEKAQR